MKRTVTRGPKFFERMIAWREAKVFKNVISVLLTLVALGLAGGTANALQAPVNLGTAGNFVVLSKSGIETTGTTSIVGNIGVSPIAAIGITGFGLIMDASNQFSTSSLVSGNVYASDYTPPTPSAMTTAISDMETAYTDAAGRSIPDATELGAGNIGGMTLAPGLYKWGTGVLIPSNGVTLSGGGDDVWIFQIGQDLTVASAAIVTLSGGARSKNIFWQVSGETTLGTTADFKGIILSKTLIALNTGAKLNGRALAQKAVTLIANAITAPSSGVGGDLNADGKSDLIWQHTDGSVIAWLMNGLVPSNSGLLIGPGSGWSVKHIGDFNGDGKRDILWQHTDGTAVIWLMNGLVQISNGLLIGPGTGWSVKQIGDFNGDGKSDLLWQHTDGSVVAWLMNGLVPSSSSLLVGAGSGWTVKQIGDFNGDGKSDLLWQHTDGSVIAWLMYGLAPSSGSSLLGPGSGWSVKQIGDFNGDGKSDLLWQHTDGTVVAWLMNGLVQSSSSLLIGPGSGWSVKQIADFNGDGKSDLLWQHTDGSVAAWLMYGLAPSSGSSLLGPGSGWSVKRVGDFNGDGKSDLLWQHTDGRAVVWLMNGLVQSSGDLLLGAGSGWSPVP